jgi:hypothetical protein
LIRVSKNKTKQKQKTKPGVDCYLYFLRPQEGCPNEEEITRVMSGEILIGQRRLEPVSGQWKEKAQLKVLEKGEKEEEKGEEEEEKGEKRGRMKGEDGGRRG